MRKIKVAALQMKMDRSREANLEKAERMAGRAAAEGANIILLPELFERQYFCQERNYSYYDFAESLEENKAVKLFSGFAKETGTVIPVSFYEKSGNTFFNTVAMIDATGEVLGIYRKTHIPDDHYYQEKFYFSPGDTGFKVWDTRYGRIGVGICWDQWFPETARSMAVMGAELLLYPTAIGSEPVLSVDSAAHWQRAMQGHSAANILPVVAANRVGREEVAPSEANGGQSSCLDFYGTSFATDETGAVIAQLSRSEEEILMAEYDLDSIEIMRRDWGVFRDRRPEMYDKISKLS